jgi:guanine deaminase
MTAVRAFRAAILHCLDNPANGPDAIDYCDDGMLVVDAGRVAAVGPADVLAPDLGPDVEIVDLSGRLLVPGFIDCHVHYPQIDIVASWGAALLDWLERYAYPEEEKYADAAYAVTVANRFADALLANGTTSALVFATVHRHSASAMFEAARSRRLRLITGKTLMDIGATPALRDTPARAMDDCRALIEQWHGCDRLGYALTPRFALTSSDEQLRTVGQLAEAYPDVWIHSHLAENRGEVEAVSRRFPRHRSYLDVYRDFGLLRERAVFAHCIHIDGDDRTCLAAANAGIAFCPSSNLFLGSGLFDLEAAEGAGIDVGIGTDVGAGPSLSMPKTLADAYRVLKLQEDPLDPLRGLYLATLGAARALRLDDVVGNFEPGKEADFTVLDVAGDTPAGRRASAAHTPGDRLFALQMLGDERIVHGTWVLGEQAWGRPG